jgi:glutamate 5-kinase
MRIVIKVGSTLLNGSSGVNRIFIDRLASQLLALPEHEFAIVTSGAIATGMKQLGMSERPKDLSMLQALAAVGQPGLMNAYASAFEGRKSVAQVLLTNHEFSNHMLYLNVRNTFNTLMGKGIIPVINENDPVSVMAIKKSAFWDNDGLAALVAVAMDADLLIIFADVDGLYDRNPTEAGAKLIREVEAVTEKEMRMCGSSNPLGRGGMLTKLRAAKIATEASIPVVIANGNGKDAVARSISGDAGTRFQPLDKPKHSERKHWLAFASEPKGRITVKGSAMTCAIDKNCGVVPADVVSVSGNFDKGDVIEIAGEDGTVLCKGVSNYFSHELEKIKGLGTDEIYRLLGFAYADVVSGADMAVVE